MTLSNRTYDILNDLVRIGIPALAAFYATLAMIWGLPAGEAVVSTAAALAAVIGVFLKISSRNYEPPTDGVIDIDTTSSDQATVRLAMDESPELYSDGGTVRLKVSSNIGRHGRVEDA